MKVLLLSAYAARSHVHWQEAVEGMFPHWDWQSLNLPPRHFAWRVRGNPLYWALEQRPVLEAPRDLLIATSMVDLATLRGLVPSLATTPTLLYFHENQFAYPPGRSQHGPLEAQMVSLYSSIAADQLGFNSAYNRDSFMAGCAALLHRLPDFVPSGVVSALQKKSVVLPVPLLMESGTESGKEHPGPRTDALTAWSTCTSPSRRPLRLLWVGRFEHDKGGERLLPLLRQLLAEGVDFELAMAGQEFRQVPSAFAALKTLYGDRLVHCGNLPTRAELHALMAAADIVLSTALHEFQGLAVMEAVRLGCVPAVPDRLAYPEIYPERFRYAGHPDDPEAEAQAATRCIVALADLLAKGEVRPPSLDDWDPAALRPRYQQVFGELRR